MSNVQCTRTNPTSFLFLCWSFLEHSPEKAEPSLSVSKGNLMISNPCFSSLHPGSLFNLTHLFLCYLAPFSLESLCMVNTSPYIHNVFSEQSLQLRFWANAWFSPKISIPGYLHMYTWTTHQITLVLNRSVHKS